jgi:hypothetical protein
MHSSGIEAKSNMRLRGLHPVKEGIAHKCSGRFRNQIKELTSEEGRFL